MSNNLIFQFGLALMILLFSTLGAWYEGSEVLERNSEWEYSTPFTHLFYGEVNDSNDISRLDHFVYAAKFKPINPILMLVSSIYLLTLLAYVFFKQNRKWFSRFIITLGILLSLFSIALYSSPTIGARVIFYVSLSIGILYIVIAVIFYVLQKNKDIQES